VIKDRVIILLLGVSFWLYETAYFGWNLRAGSDAEIICDGIALIIMCIGFVPIRADVVIDKMSNNVHIEIDV